MQLLIRRLIIVALCCAPMAAHALGGGATPIACTATPPSAASAAGLTKPVLCDSFSNNHGIDAANTQKPGYSLYAASPANTCRPITPPGKISNDGTGVNLLSAGGSGGRGLTTSGPSATSPFYVGTVISGSFYAEVDMKWNPTTPSNYDGWPAFWVTSTAGYVGYLQGGCASNSSLFPYLEIDIMEFLPGSVGQSGSNNMGYHDWQWNGGNANAPCSGGGPNNGNLNISNFNTYNTYGFLFLTRADNGGTGKLQWIINNGVAMTCTYTSSSAISCDANPSGTCTAANIVEFETQLHDFLFAVSSNNVWPEQIRNLHVWQKP